MRNINLDCIFTMPLNCEKWTEYNWVTERTWWGYRWHFWTTRLSASRWTQRPQGRTCSQKSQTICRLVSECQKFLLEQIVAYELAIFLIPANWKRLLRFLTLGQERQDSHVASCRQEGHQAAQWKQLQMHVSGKTFSTLKTNVLLRNTQSRFASVVIVSLGSNVEGI